MPPKSYTIRFSKRVVSETVIEADSKDEALKAFRDGDFIDDDKTTTVEGVLSVKEATT